MIISTSGDPRLLKTVPFPNGWTKEYKKTINIDIVRKILLGLVILYFFENNSLIIKL